MKGFIYRAYNWFLKGDFSVENEKEDDLMNDDNDNVVENMKIY